MRAADGKTRQGDQGAGSDQCGASDQQARSELRQAAAFMRARGFVTNAVSGGDLNGKFELQIMYGIGGERDLTVRTLDHLSGYQGARPVRVGNGAWNQQQHDVWGDDSRRPGRPVPQWSYPVIAERDMERLQGRILMDSARKPSALFVYFTYTQQTLKVVQAMA